MLIPQLEALQREYHVGLGISPPTSEAEIRRSGRAGLSVDVGMPDGDVSSGRRRVRARVKAMMPTPVWDGLRRVKRAWRALLGPLPGPTS